ncbi:MAG: hypothetical protein IQL11_16935 [Bacteroidales bacterium]|nr:hypothetical protein [Bacteroidales bacterium]
MDEQFIFSKQYRNILPILAAVSLVVFLLAVVLSGSGSARIWSNILLNNQFFLGISLGAAFFIAVHRVATSGWQTVIQRVPDAMTSFLPVAFILMLLIYFGMNDIYAWADSEVYEGLTGAKKIWLNIPFYFVRMVLYFAGWIFFIRMMKKNSESLTISSDLKYHNRRKIFAGLFLVFFGITVSASSWDWIMSLKPDWYSTIFGWYVLISMFVASLCFIILITWLLRRMGYLKVLRSDHVHDLAILLFAFSIFWAYQWFAQYLLIWYGHLPEETSYFIPRQHEFTLLFFLNLGINFIVPFFGLIRTSSKYNLNRVAAIAAMTLIGHWIDYWLLIMPETAGTKATIGLPEISMTLIYACGFIYIFFRTLSHGPLIVKNDPFLQESLNYES